MHFQGLYSRAESLEEVEAPCRTLVSSLGVGPLHVRQDIVDQTAQELAQGLLANGWRTVSH